MTRAPEYVNGRMYDVHLRSRLCEYLAKLGGTVKREVTIGTVRADVVRMSNQIEGYEIKGDSDPVWAERFKKQVRAYSQVFDRCWLVRSSNCDVKATMRCLPEWWGILLIDPTGRVVHYRMAFRNSKQQIDCLASQIWRIDLIRLLRHNGFNKNVSRFQKDTLIEMACANLRPEIIRQAVINQWTERKCDMRDKDLRKEHHETTR